MQVERIRQRSRLLTADRKSQLCALVAQSNTIESAAAALGVSLRTVQRERKLDEQFDSDVRRALGASPDPLKLMEAAARTHWRAAAWLLERTRPEKYGRRPTNAANYARVSRAMSSAFAALLAKLPTEQQAALLGHADEAMEHALDSCFPNRQPAPQPLAPGSSSRGPNGATPTPKPAPPAGRTLTPAPPGANLAAPSRVEQPPAPTPALREFTPNELDAATVNASTHSTHLTNNERKRRQRQAAQLSRKIKKATRKQNRRAA